MTAKKYGKVGGFLSTHWSLIYKACDQDSVQRRKALDELLGLYLPALRAHLLYRRNIDSDRVEDILQGFVAEQILKRDLFAKANAAKGRFRSFLLRSLENYAINERLREARRREVEIEEETAVAATSDVFEVEWARQTLQETLRRMRAACENKGRPDLWELFACRVVVPTLTGSPPPSYDSLLQKFGFRSAQQASNALLTAKRYFERTLRTVIAEMECVASEQDIEAEITDLCNILVEVGPLAVACDHGLIAGPQPSGQKNLAVLDESNPTELAGLLAVRGRPEGNWLGDFVGDCLAVPTSEYLGSRGQPAEFAADSPSECAVVDTALGELLQSVDPPLGLLIAVKRRARRLTRAGANDLLVEIHHLIYLASIAAALVRHGHRISKSGSEVLLVAWERLAAEPYVADGLRRLFATAKERLADHGQSGQFTHPV